MCSSLSAANLSLCAVMEFDETFVERRFLDAQWEVMVLLFQALVELFTVLW